MNCEICNEDIEKTKIRKVNDKNICESCIRLMVSMESENRSNLFIKSTFESEFIPCPHCNYNIHPESTYCPRCGKLTKLSAVKTIDKISQGAKTVFSATDEGIRQIITEIEENNYIGKAERTIKIVMRR